MTNRQLAAQETKKKLLRAGKKLICEKELGNISVEEITEEAGVSKGTFYTYFKRKEDIVFELSRDMFGEILQRAKSFDGSFLEKLKHYMVCFSEYIEQGGVRMSQEWVKNVVNPGLAEHETQRGKLSFDLSSVRELIALGVEEGALKEDIPACRLTCAIVDLLYGQMFCWSMSGGAYSLKGRTEEFCEVGLQALFQEYIK